MKWINKNTDIYCSFSKTAGNTGCQFMNTMFYYYDLNKIYKSFSISDIGSAIQAARILDIKGFAISMPYKKEVLKYVDNLTEAVKKIESANTIINNDGILTAYNTDYLAAKDFLKEYMKIENKNHNKKIYILGNGGYSLAVQHAFKSLNFYYNLITRDNWDDIKNIKNSIIFNCTPVKNIDVHESNNFIDCLVKTNTGKKLARLQALYQFNLYTGINVWNDFN